MLEADVVDGDLTQIMHAVQNALRPSQSQIRVIQQRDTVTALPEPDVSDEAQAHEQAAQETIAPSTRSPRPATKRSYRTPEVVDVDLDSSVSFREFASTKSPNSVKDKYLIVAAWFKMHRDTSAITSDHAFTCFRKIGWS